MGSGGGLCGPLERLSRLEAGAGPAGEVTHPGQRVLKEVL